MTTAGRQQTTAEYFQQRIESADPPGHVIQQAIAGHAEIRRALDELSVAPRTFLTGSYDRYTHNQPLEDVDIFLVLENQNEADVQQSMSRVERHLRRWLPSGTRFRAQEKSIGVSLMGYHVSFDVIPALAAAPLTLNLADYDGGFRIPAKENSGFVPTFPLQVQRALQQASERCDRLVPLIKLVKQMNASWACPLRDEHGHIVYKDGKPSMTKPLNSFHLEVMCYSADIAKFSNDRIRFIALVHQLSGKVRDSTLRSPGGGVPLNAYFNDARSWSLDQVVQWLSGIVERLLIAYQHEYDGLHYLAICRWGSVLDRSEVISLI